MAPKLIITGATRGIGRAVLERFLVAGFDAAFCGTNPDTVQQVQEACREKFGRSGIFGITADLSAGRPAAEQFGKEALELLGGCNVLVNNAGVFKPGGILTEEDGTYEELMAVNMNQVYHLSRLVVPEIIRQQRGHVFNMCSIASIKAYPDGGSYCISKFALFGFSQVLREELKPHGLCVTAVLPGATLTDSWAGAGYPDERFARADDVAELMISAWNVNRSACTEQILLRPLAGDI